MSDTEILGRATFEAIRYAQVWEDADILVEALKPRPEETVVSIGSAGDNALALLAEGPKRVIAVDLSAAQLACIRLRAAAYRTLSHADLLALIGSRPSTERAALLERAARSLSSDDQAFWKAREGQVVRYGAGGVGKFERYFRIFRQAVLPLVHRRKTIEALLEPRAPEDRAVFFATHWNTPAWRSLLGVFFSRAVMGRLGRDPEFFRHVQGSVSDHVARLTRHALVVLDPSQNPYLAWILTGRHGEALPRPLRPEAFDAIRNRLDCLDIRLATAESLAAEGVRAHAFNLSDIFEYMSPEGHLASYRAVLDAAAPGARIAYWNMMAPRRVPQVLAHRVATLSHVEEALGPRDKAFFYSAFVVEQVV